MRAIVLDRANRVLTIESVKRKGRVLYRKDTAYSMRGVSWAFGKPAYPRYIYIIQYIPFIGPLLSNWLFTRDTFVILANGIATTLEPRSDMLEQSMTDEQALSIMEAHSEAMSIGRKGMDATQIIAVGAIIIAALVVLSILF